MQKNVNARNDVERVCHSELVEESYSNEVGLSDFVFKL